MLKYLQKAYVMSVASYMGADLGNPSNIPDDIDTQTADLEVSDISTKELIDIAKASGSIDQRELQQITDKIAKDQEEVDNAMTDMWLEIRQESILKNKELLVNILSQQVANAKLDGWEFTNWNIEKSNLRSTTLNARGRKVAELGLDWLEINGIEIDKGIFSSDTKMVLTPSMMSFADKIGITEDMVIDNANVLVKKELIARQESRKQIRLQQVEAIKSRPSLIKEYAEEKSEIGEEYAEVASRIDGGYENSENSEVDQIQADLDRMDKEKADFEMAVKWSEGLRELLQNWKIKIADLTPEQDEEYAMYTWMMIRGLWLDMNDWIEGVQRIIKTRPDGVLWSKSALKTAAYSQDQISILDREREDQNKKLMIAKAKANPDAGEAVA